MKKFQFLFLYGVVVVTFVACVSDHQSENIFLGEIPALAAEYHDQIAALRQKADESTDMQEAFEYAARAKNLSKTADTEIAKAFAKLSQPVIIPHDQQHGKNAFLIRQLAITGATADHLYIEATAEVLDPGGTNRLFAYVCGQDEQGKDLMPMAVLMSTYHPEKGGEVKFTGLVQQPWNFGGLVRIRTVSRAHYDRMK